MNTVLRRAVVLVLVAWGLLLSTASTAAADVAEGWSEPPTVSGLDMLWILLGAPVLCYLIVALLAYLPGLVKGERTPAKGLERDDTWFGDPRL